MNTTYPTRVNKTEDRLLSIVWSDEREDQFDVVDLRRRCRCARCVDELTGKQVLRAEDVPEDLRPTQVKSLGRYALTLDWTDGHSSIFSWEQLRKWKN